MFDLAIRITGHATRVLVKPGILGQTGPLLLEASEAEPGTPVFMITDTRVGALYADLVLDSLRRVGYQPYEHRVEPGEQSKSLRITEEVYRTLASRAVGRDAVIFALGGGVVSDLAGFVAATWMRGVCFAISPTTLEADIDASIGGKTAVNVPGGKNLVGAFHQPALVAVDPSCLETLDPRDYRAGLGESIKHALISSDDFLAWHEENAEAILALDQHVMSELVLRNLRIKAEIVQRDPHELTGARMVLNLGHTIGHAIEVCGEFKLRHGECVALGTLAACRLSHALGLLDESVVKRVEHLLARFALPTKLAEPIDSARILTALRNDKKVRSGKVQFVLLEDLGRPVVHRDVSERQAREAYESLLP